MNTFVTYEIEIKEGLKGRWEPYYECSSYEEKWESASLLEAKKRAKELSEYVSTANDGKKTYTEARVVKVFQLTEIVETFTSKKLSSELKKLRINNG